MTPTEPDRSAPYRPIPGPLDRDTFFAAQDRHRRATRWLSLLATFAIILVGFPLAAILFPMLFGVASLISLGLAKIFHVPDLAGMLINHPVDPTTATQWLGVGLVVCLPGSVAMLVIWRTVVSAFTRADLAAVFLHLGARPPRSDDAEERQLINVVDEIAIAALLPAPRVMLLDNSTINVAALGATPQTATLVVTRGLLDHCDRDETQALIADAVAAIGNGDLRVTLRWMAVSVTLTIVRRLLQAPYWAAARESLRGMRGLLWQKGARDPVADAAVFAELLRDQAEEPGDLSGGSVRRALSFPFFMAHVMFNAVAWFASLLFLSPALTLLLRRRRYLADAIAVQLTRYPDALASALSRVIRQPLQPRTVPSLLTLLFVVDQPNQFSDANRPLGFFFGTHPSLSKRHQRVGKMGLLASGDDPSQFARLAALPPGQRLLVGVLMALLIPLSAAVIYLMLYLIVALTLLSLAVGMIYVLIVIMPLRWLLGA